MNSALLRPALILGAVGIFSKVIQVLAGLLLAYRFGANTGTDAYLLAKSAPIGLYLIVDSLVYNAFLPFYQHERRARTNVLIVAGWMLLAGALAGSALFATAPWIVALLGQGASLESRAGAAELLRWMAIAVLFFFPASVLKAVNAAQQRYVLAALDGLVIGATLAAALLLAAQGTDYRPLAIALPVSGGLLLAVQAIFARADLRVWPGSLSIPGGRQLLGASAPLLGVNSLQQFLALFMVAAAGYLGSGALSCMNFSYSLIQIPVGVVDLILMSAWFPLAAAMVHNGDRSRLLHSLERTAAILLRATVPLALWLVLMRVELIRAVLQYGAFDGVAAERTAHVIVGHALALPGWLLEALACRCLFAQQRHSAYLAVMVLRCITLPLLCLLLIPGFDLLGISLAFAASTTLGAAFAFWLIHGRAESRIALSRWLHASWRIALPTLALACAHFLWRLGAPHAPALPAAMLLPIHAFASLALLILCYRLTERIAPGNRP